jgi:NAD(P)-dependent dehydrogenase (short-subunit alcohol dehydrogenase family)
LSQAKQAVGQYMREATRLSRGGSIRRGGPIRGARPEEIARAVVFLGSEEGGFITGATLSINGGQYMM